MTLRILARHRPARGRVLFRDLLARLGRVHVSGDLCKCPTWFDRESGVVLFDPIHPAADCAVHSTTRKAA